MAYSYSTTAKYFSEEKTLSIVNFLGVDYSTNPLSVDTYHAIKAKNLYRRDKTTALLKRYGVVNLYNFTSKETFHNFWSFVDKEGNEHNICNIGGSLYALTLNENIPLFSSISSNAVLNQSVSAFPCNNRLYILGGKNYLMLEYVNGSFHLTKVLNSDYAYVPTTTIGITPTENPSGNRQSLDAVNMLTWWRKNRLVSGTNYTSDEDHTVVINTIQTFALDTSITFKNESEMDNFSVVIKFYDGNNDDTTHQTASLNTYKLIAKQCNGINLAKLDETRTEVIYGLGDDDTTRNGKIYVLLDSATYTSNVADTIKNAILTPTNDATITGYSGVVNEKGEQLKIYGYVLLDGTICLFNDYPNQNGESNIVVEFPHYTIDKEQTPVDKCTIGIIHTANNFNSLFVAGNTEKPATDWHTESINTSTLSDEELELINEQDLVYFPDTSYCNYGQDNMNPIIGYDNLGTGSLMVLKKHQNYEPTIYFRAGTMVAVSGAVDIEGNSLYKQEYSLTTGNIGNSAISFKAMINFKGDTLFVSNENTIEGLDKETEAYDNQRYSNTRSYYIDKYLKTLDLTNAFFYVDGDNLYFVNGGDCFVNDYGDITNTNYEWYHLQFESNITAMTKINGKIYFGTLDGKFYSFGDSFVDIERIDPYATFLTEKDTNYIVVDSTLLPNLAIGDKLISPIPIVYSLGVKDTDFTINDDQLTIINYDKLFKVFASKITVIYNSKLYDLVKNENDDNYTLTNERETGVSETLDNGTLYRAFYELTISSIDSNNNFITFTEIDNFSISQSLTSGYFVRNVVVEAYFMTAPYTLGSAQYYKNLHSILLTNDKGVGGETMVDFIDDYVSVNSSEKQPSISAGYGINLATFDFNKNNYEGTRVPVRIYPFRINLLRKKYCCFNFYNDKATNMVLSACYITYSMAVRI